MKKNKEYVVLVLVIVALSGYIALKKAGRTHYEIPALPAFEKEDISKLTIRKGGQETILTLVGEGWVVRPGDYPADKAQVDGMLDAIHGLTLTSVASEAGNDSLYQLDETGRIEVEAGKGDEILRSLYVGKAAPTNRHTFVKLSGQGPVYHAGGMLRNSFEKNAEQLRDMQVMKIDGDIKQIVLTQGKDVLRIVKVENAPAAKGESVADQESKEGGRDEESKWLTEDGRPVKGEEVQAMIQALSSLKCDGYVKDEKREDRKDPIFSVSLAGKKNYAFSVYGEQDKKFVCTSSENNYVFLIPEWRMKKIRLDLKSLIQAQGQGSAAVPPSVQSGAL